VVFSGFAAGTRSAIINSGCTAHISPYRDLFTSYTPIDPVSILAANKTSFVAVGRGDVELTLPNGRTTTRLILKNILHCPGTAFTLVSMSTMNRARFSFVLGTGHLLVRAPNGEQIADIPEDGGLYRIPMQGPIAVAAIGGELVVKIDKLHRRLGHIGVEACHNTVRRGMIDGVHLVDATAPAVLCEPCERSKVAEKTFPSESATPHMAKYGGQIHSEVWGPAPVMSIGKREYMLTFTDEHTHEVSLYFLAKKSDTFVAYKQFEAWVSMHRQVMVKILHTDCGGEYMLCAFGNHLSAQGTKHKLTIHDSPSQNGVTECLNQTLLSHSRACMLATDLPKSLWAEAIQYVAWMKNQTPTHTLTDKTPHKMATGVKPDLRNVHAWGSRIFVRVEGRGKLDAQADPAFFVGYDRQSKGYRVYWRGKHSISCERNVRWDECGTVPIEGETLTSGNQPEPQVPYINRLRSAGNHSQDPVLPTGLLMQRVANAAIAFDSAVPWELCTSVMESSGVYWALAGEIIREPCNVKDAKHLPQWPKWQATMEEEMCCIKELSTWTLVPKPTDANVVGCKWVYKLKRDAKGDITRYKARLVALGFTQVPRVDYVDMFAPVVKFSTLCVLLTLVTHYNWEVHQMDVKNAYLNGTLTETIFMRQPPGFVDASNPKYICRLACGLYGLQQSGCVCYQTLMHAFKDLGFGVCAVDHAVFI
jgi:hypothetical protein